MKDRELKVITPLTNGNSRSQWSIEACRWHSSLVKSKELPVLLGKLHAIETKRQHVLVAILVQELLVKVLVNFVVLLLVTVESIQNAVLHFGPTILNKGLEFSHALTLLYALV